MDVILLNASPSERFYRFNRYIGSYKIAHWLRKHGYTAQVIDFIALLTEEQLYSAIKKFITEETLVIGLSTTFLIGRERYTWSDGQMVGWPEHLSKVLWRIRSEHPKIKIVAGGYASDNYFLGGLPHVTIMSYTTATEDVFLEYIDHLRHKGPRPLGFVQENFFTLEDQSKKRMIFNEARNPKYNIETDDFHFTHQDAILDNEPLPLDVSRGCIFACRFCQYPHLGKKKLDYVRGMQYIRDELMHNYENFGTTRYMILDDTFNDTEWKMQEFHRMTSSLPFKITYSTYLRADLIDRFPDTAHMLKESGCFGAYHGIESLHPYGSKLVGKAWSGKRAREFIPYLYHDLWKGQVPQHVNFITGLPRETFDDLKGTVRWFLDNKLYNINFHQLNLNGINNKRKNMNIMSEFDRNSEKYGFSQQNKSDDPDSVEWVNETWTHSDARRAAAGLNAYLTEYRHVPVWNIGSFEFLGYDRDFIMNTVESKFNVEEIFQREQDKLNQYHQKLMSL